MTDGQDWFAPKRYGYGAGLPIAWQGWLAVAIYAAVLIAGTFLVAPNLWAIASIVIPATAIFVIISAQKTRGGWRWRWGEED
jgi:hypothetical protein